jgi:hypothetical protein
MVLASRRAKANNKAGSDTSSVVLGMAACWDNLKLFVGKALLERAIAVYSAINLFAVVFTAYYYVRRRRRELDAQDKHGTFLHESFDPRQAKTFALAIQSLGMVAGTGALLTAIFKLLAGVATDIRKVVECEELPHPVAVFGVNAGRSAEEKHCAQRFLAASDLTDQLRGIAVENGVKDWGVYKIGFPTWLNAALSVETADEFFAVAESIDIPTNYKDQIRDVIVPGMKAVVHPLEQEDDNDRSYELFAHSACARIGFLNSAKIAAEEAVAAVERNDEQLGLWMRLRRAPNRLWGMVREHWRILAIDALIMSCIFAAIYLLVLIAFDFVRWQKVRRIQSGGPLTYNEYKQAVRTAGTRDFKPEGGAASTLGGVAVMPGVDVPIMVPPPASPSPPSDSDEGSSLTEEEVAAPVAISEEAVADATPPKKTKTVQPVRPEISKEAQMANTTSSRKKTKTVTFVKPKPEGRRRGRRKDRNHYYLRDDFQADWADEWADAWMEKYDYASDFVVMGFDHDEHTARHRFFDMFGEEPPQDMDQSEMDDIMQTALEEDYIWRDDHAAHYEGAVRLTPSDRRRKFFESAVAKAELKAHKQRVKNALAEVPVPVERPRATNRTVNVARKIAQAKNSPKKNKPVKKEQADKKAKVAKKTKPQVDKAVRLESARRRLQGPTPEGFNGNHQLNGAIVRRCDDAIKWDKTSACVHFANVTVATYHDRKDRDEWLPVSGEDIDLAVCPPQDNRIPKRGNLPMRLFSSMPNIESEKWWFVGRPRADMTDPDVQPLMGGIRVEGTRVYHRANTMKGSCGGVIINQHGKVLAIHHGSYGPWDDGVAEILPLYYDDKMVSLFREGRRQ